VGFVDVDSRYLLVLAVSLTLFVQCVALRPGQVAEPSLVRSQIDGNALDVRQFQSSSSWLSGWDFRKPHTIIGSPGTGTNYQVIVKVYNTTGTDSGDTVYVGSKCKTDFSDIRFTASDGITLLSYWLASVSGSLATFWVKVMDDLGSNQVIYIYYGNSGASGLSNGFATFMFFDDFDDGVVDTSRWNILTTMLPGAGSQSYDETGGKLHIYSYATSGWQGYYFYSKTNFTTTNFAIHLESTWTNLDYDRGGGGFNQGGYLPSNNKPTEFALALYGSYSVYGYHYLEWVPNWNADIADLSSGTAQMDLSLSGTSYNDVLSGTYSTTKTGTNSAFSGTFQVLLANTIQYWTDTVSCDTYWDIVYMRKYVASEPQHGTWGVEESAGTTTSTTSTSTTSTTTSNPGQSNPMSLGLIAGGLVAAVAVIGVIAISTRKPKARGPGAIAPVTPEAATRPAPVPKDETGQRKLVLGALKSYPRVSMMELGQVIGLPMEKVRQFTLQLLADDAIRGTFDRSTDEFVSAHATEVGRDLKKDIPSISGPLACPYCGSALPWVLGIGETRKCPSCGWLLSG